MKKWGTDGFLKKTISVINTLAYFYARMRNVAASKNEKKKRRIFLENREFFGKMRIYFRCTRHPKSIARNGKASMFRKFSQFFLGVWLEVGFLYDFKFFWFFNFFLKFIICFEKLDERKNY